MPTRYAYCRLALSAGLACCLSGGEVRAQSAPATLPRIDIPHIELYRNSPTRHTLYGKPVGLFLMTRPDPATQTVTYATWYFLGTGEVYLNPDTGFSADELATKVERHGTYIVDNKTLTVKWADGKTTRAGYRETSGDVFSWDDATFQGVAVFPTSGPSGSRLLGTYRASGTATGGTTVDGSTTVTFLPDGTYSTAAKGGKAQLAGRWVLTGYYLTINDTKGKLTRAVCFPLEDRATPLKPSRFYFAGALYDRQAE